MPNPITKQAGLFLIPFAEEVFSSNKAVWISADGKKMAYAKFNDTVTPVMLIPVYGQPGSLQFQYPQAAQIRYPKVCTKFI